MNDTIGFYTERYDLIGQWFLRPGKKQMLGDKHVRICRFCGERPPKATFRKVAHAIPEALGNKSLESAYECDECNELFGKGIENDLGNWTKPMRTIARIRGKSGVPTLKKGGDAPGWRIEYDEAGFNIKSYEHDPIFEIDEANHAITLKLKRDSYTPVAVLKAFMKIGLTLLPDSEIGNFTHLMNWVRSADHGHLFAQQCAVIYSFLPGPMPNDLIAAFILRRKQAVCGVPYAFLVIGYGNEVFQVMLPSELHDGAANGKTFAIPPFVLPDSPDWTKYGPRRSAPLDLTGRDVVRGEVVSIQLGYEEALLDEKPIGG